MCDVVTKFMEVARWVDVDPSCIIVEESLGRGFAIGVILCFAGSCPKGQLLQVLDACLN